MFMEEYKINLFKRETSSTFVFCIIKRKAFLAIVGKHQSQL